MKHKIKTIAILSGETIMLMVLVLITYVVSKNFIESKFVKYEITNTIIENKVKTSSKEISDEEYYENLLIEKDDAITFFSNTFQINKDTLINKLSQDYAKWNKKEEENFDKYLIEYLLELEKTDSKLFSKNKTACKESKEYMVALIKYFTSIYPNVDFSIASGIAEVESGFSAPGMLKKNNIFGGMSNGKLIKYKNIEYGILRYIKLLNDGYFAKGLTTIEAIGRVYNPTFNEKGQKIAKTSWVKNVTNASKNYSEYDSVDISLLKDLKKEA